MATVLMLNGTQVFPDGKQQIKLIRENPYFTQSESYTLDVTLPMDILENRQFFGNLQRIEQSKQTSIMTCRLTVDNKPLLQGSAKVTQITDKDVKVQLIGGISEIKFLSNENKTYIDEMELGGEIATYVPNTPGPGQSGRGGTLVYNDVGIDYLMMNVYNETAEHTSRTPNPNLHGIFEKVIEESGYSIESNERNVEPWNCIYIASAKRTLFLSHVLPHWTVKEFVEEYCRFFNCSLVIDQLGRKVRVVANENFFGTARHIGIEPVDEYTVETNEDSQADSLGNSNLSFDLSGSDDHDYDIIPDNVRDSAPTTEYTSRNEALAAYNEMNEDERLRQIYKTPVGRWAGWKHDYSDVQNPGETTLFTQIDVFGPLIRDADSDSEISLKICPVAISETTDQFTGRGAEWTVRMLTLENPTGDENDLRGQIEEEEDGTIQEYIEGEVEIEKSGKEDRIQVFFWDDIEQDSICVSSTNPRQGNRVGDISKRLMPFTDFLYKKNHSGASHRLWSLSLNPTEAEHYLGELHHTTYTFNTKAKYCVKFLADEMPDPTQVFIIRNKRFGCEKIETQIDDRGLLPLMTGYFYEML